MARWSGIGRIGSYLLAGTAIATAMGTAARAQFPGEVWGVSYVRVSGTGAANVTNGLTLGLTDASNVYFYGDTAARIEANVTSANVVDLKMVDLGSGKVVAERRGLPFDGAGDVAGTVSNAALAWMESLNCAEGCTVARSGPAPQSVQTAAAPAIEQPEPETAEPEAVEVAEPPKPEPVAIVEAPKPEVVVATETPEPVEVAQTAQPQPVVVAPAPKAEPVQKDPTPEPVIALAQPQVSVPQQTSPVTQAALKNPTAEAIVLGLDADQVLAAVDAPDVRKPASEVTTAPAADTRSSAAPSVVALPKPKVSRPSANAPTKPETFAVASAAPASDEAPALALAVPSSDVVKPETPAQAATGSQPEVAAVEPQTEVKLPPVPSVTAPDPEEPATIAAEVPPAPTAPAPAVAVSEPEPEPEPAAVVATAPTPLPAPSTRVEAPEETTPKPEPEASVEAPTPAPAEEPTPEAPSLAADETPSLVNPAPSGGATEQLALATPVIPQVPAVPTAEAQTEAEATSEATAPAAVEGNTVETQLAAVDPQQDGPTLANARWIGFTPAVFTGADTRAGAWIAGPFDRKQRTGWITDTATGATTRVTFYWREASSGGRTATLSREAASALGIGQGDVANVAVYLPR